MDSYLLKKFKNDEEIVKFYNNFTDVKDEKLDYLQNEFKRLIETKQDFKEFVEDNLYGLNALYIHADTESFNDLLKEEFTDADIKLMSLYFAMCETYPVSLQTIDFDKLCEDSEYCLFVFDHLSEVCRQRSLYLGMYNMSLGKKESIDWFKILAEDEDYSTMCLAMIGLDMLTNHVANMAPVEFNCNEFNLDETDIDNLIDAVNSNGLDRIEDYIKNQPLEKQNGLKRAINELYDAFEGKSEAIA